MHGVSTLAPARWSLDAELTARTDAGARLVALAERLAADFADAGRRARPRRQLPVREHRRAAGTRGYFAAPIPDELGGLGVESVHDLLVASSRLARGDASVTIGVNMHLIAVVNMARRWRLGRRRRQRAARAAFAASLRAIARTAW